MVQAAKLWSTGVISGMSTACWTIISWLLPEVITAGVIVLFVVVLLLLAVIIGIMVLVFFRR